MSRKSRPWGPRRQRVPRGYRPRLAPVELSLVEVSIPYDFGGRAVYIWQDLCTLFPAALPAFYQEAYRAWLAQPHRERVQFWVWVNNRRLDYWLDVTPTSVRLGV